MRGNKICTILDIEIPIIQAGMVWNSGWELASEVSKSGALGVLGSGSMYPEELENNILKVKQLTKNTFGVNIPLISPYHKDLVDVVIKHQVPVIITSAGSPSTYTSFLQNAGLKVGHVVSSLKFAEKSKQAGVDFIIGEGFEAGGHNGREESTTMVLTPLLTDNLDLPIVTAGGISDGKSMLAAFALGADAVQIGSRFIASIEASSHLRFKNYVIQSEEGGTVLSLKKLAPVRLMKNKFYRKVKELEDKAATMEEFKELLGKGRAKKGMSDGDLDDGELEVGQVACRIHKLMPASEIIAEI